MESNCQITSVTKSFSHQNLPRLTCKDLTTKIQHYCLMALSFDDVTVFAS